MFTLPRCMKISKENCCNPLAYTKLIITSRKGYLTENKGTMGHGLGSVGIVYTIYTVRGKADCRVIAD